MAASVGSSSSGVASAPMELRGEHYYRIEEIELDGTVFDKSGKEVGPAKMKARVLTLIKKEDNEKVDVSKVAKKLPLVRPTTLSYTFCQVKKIHEALLTFWKQHAVMKKIDADKREPIFDNFIHRWVWDNYSKFEKNGKKDADIVHYIGPKPGWRSEENIKINCHVPRS